MRPLGLLPQSMAAWCPLPHPKLSLAPVAGCVRPAGHWLVAFWSGACPELCLPLINQPSSSPLAGVLCTRETQQGRGVLANQMHPDSKLTNHGKTGNGGAQPQHHNVSQSPTCNLGAKGVGAGSHGGPASQPAPGNSGLKSGQAPLPAFGVLKGKVKRERSVSVDSGERREASTASLDKELKGEGAPCWLAGGWQDGAPVARPRLPGAPLGAALGVPPRLPGLLGYRGWAPPWRRGRLTLCPPRPPRLQTKWPLGASGAACWSGSSRIVGTSGAPALTARTTRSPSAAPTVSPAGPMRPWAACRECSGGREPGHLLGPRRPGSPTSCRQWPMGGAVGEASPGCGQEFPNRGGLWRPLSWRPLSSTSQQGSWGILIVHCHLLDT